MGSARWTPLAVLAVGFSFSLAANLLWTWPGGPVRILGGAFASIALPAAVHMWPRIQATTWRIRWLRNIVMVVIAVMAAATTFEHASQLLIAHGEQVWLARAYPVMTELLVVFAVLARHTPPPRKAKPAPKPTATPAKVEPTKPVEPPSDIAERGQQRAVMVMWAQTQNELPPIKAIQNKFKVSQSTAKRVRKDVMEMAS